MPNLGEGLKILSARIDEELVSSDPPIDEWDPVARAIRQAAAKAGLDDVEAFVEQKHWTWALAKRGRELNEDGYFTTPLPNGVLNPDEDDE